MVARCRRRQSAFTLIEILVVVAIIALLVAILLPSLARAREQGRQAVCGSNNKQIGIAMRMFGEEHKQYYPDYYRWFSWPPWRLYVKAGDPPNEVERKTREFLAIAPFTGVDSHGIGFVEGHVVKYVGKQRDIFVCPSDDGVRTHGAGDWSYQPPGRGNYSMQKDLQRIAENLAKDQGRVIEEGPLKGQPKPPFWCAYSDLDPMKYVWFKEEHLMGSPSRVMMLMEQGGSRPLGTGPDQYGPFNDVTAKWREQTLIGGQETMVQDDYLEARHTKRGHLMFFDGHVEAILSDTDFNGPQEANTPAQRAMRKRAATKAGFYFDRLYSNNGRIYVRSGTHRNANDRIFK